MGNGFSPSRSASAGDYSIVTSRPTSRSGHSHHAEGSPASPFALNLREYLKSDDGNVVARFNRPLREPRGAAAETGALSNSNRQNQRHSSQLPNARDRLGAHCCGLISRQALAFLRMLLSGGPSARPRLKASIVTASGSICNGRTLDDVYGNSGFTFCLRSTVQKTKKHKRKKAKQRKR